MMKIIFLLPVLILAGCSTISLEERFGSENNNGVSLKEAFYSCPTIHGTEILREHVEKSFFEGDKRGYDGDYNASTVAKEFLLFAIAAENAYLDKGFDSASISKNSRRGASNNFIVEAYDAGWEFQERIPSVLGFAFDYYFNNQDENVFKVLVAFRGTESWSLSDWINGNLAPVTEWLPLHDQYQLARKQFNEVRKRAFQKAHGKAIYYYATGHSLGGGLAQHIAEAFPCVSAVVFNSSPVTLAYRLNPRIRGGYIIDIVENHDPLRIATEIFRPVERSMSALLQFVKGIDRQTFNKLPRFDDSDSRKNYYTFSDLNMSELSDGSDHFLSPFAASMSRMVTTDCVLHKEDHFCNDDRLAQKAAQLYCNSGWAKDENGNINDDACPSKIFHKEMINKSTI